MLNISVPTYYRYQKAYENGIRSSKKCGRKQLLTPSTKVYIRNLISRCKYLTTKEIYQKCTNLGKICSIGTIKKYLISLKYYHKKAKKKPLLSRKTKKKRLAFCIKNYNCDYKSLVCVDESHFINVPQTGEYYWSKSSKKKDIGVSKVRMNVSIFGAISWKKKYPLYFYDGRLNSERYREILTKYHKMFERYESKIYVVQQDNAPCHNGKKNKEYFNRLGVNFIDHPPSSPDLNSIEHVWGEVKRKVLTYTFSNEQQLKQAITDEWNNFDIEKFRSIQKNWKRRMSFVIRNKGGNGYN